MDELEPDLFGAHLERGEDLRDGAMASLEGRYAGLLMALREEARKVVARAGRVTTDDLRLIAKIKGVEVVDPHLWGAIFKELDSAGEPVWRCTARTKSTIPENNGRLIGVWVLR